MIDSGIFGTLSTSLNKMRKDGKHNSSSVSERSTYSYASFMERSSMLPNKDISEVGDFNEAMTPTVRKRKADEETVPFSASKKYATVHIASS